jgi:hypothetical protein
MLLMGKREVNVFLTREVIQSYELAGPAACTACSRRRMTVRNKPSNSKDSITSQHWVQGGIDERQALKFTPELQIR